MNFVKSEDILRILATLKKPISYQTQKTFPYHELDDRAFEVLIYLIFQEEINSKKFSKNYDRITLMVGVNEKGQDSILHYREKKVGLIQCKCYSERLSKSEVAKELIKFALYYYLDKSLIPDLQSFTYFLYVANDFTGPALDLLTNFNQQMPKLANLKELTLEILEKYESFSHVKDDDIEKHLLNFFTQIKIEKKNKFDLNSQIFHYPEIINQFFSIQQVVSIEENKRMIENLFEEKHIKAVTDSDLRRLLEKIENTPDEYRFHSGIFDFYGYHTDFFQYLIDTKKFEPLLKKITDIKVEISNLVMDTINEKIDHEILVRISKNKAISPFTKQAAKPYLFAKFSKRIMLEKTPNIIHELLIKASLVFKIGTIPEIKRELIDTAEQFLKGNYSVLVGDPEIVEFKIQVLTSVYSEFTNIQEMSTRFDTDMIIMQPILDAIEADLNRLVPLDPVIVFNEENFLNDRPYTNSIFARLKKFTNFG
jgi:hypothetical protein